MYIVYIKYTYTPHKKGNIMRCYRNRELYEACEPRRGYGEPMLPLIADAEVHMMMHSQDP